MSTISPNDFELIESIVNELPPKAQEDTRSLFQGWSRQFSQLQTATGVVPGSNSQNVAKPPQAAISVQGKNAVYSIAITPPTTPQPSAIWHEVSYSPVKGFTNGVTTLEPTTGTSFQVNEPNGAFFFRVRSSYNKQVWNDYVWHGNAPVMSGLVSSAATNSGGAFNQTNLGTVTSKVAGGAAAVDIQGAGGALTAMVAVKGGSESILPPATVVGVNPGTDQFVGYDGENYNLHPTLAAVMDDAQTPVGKVSVVSTKAPAVPIIVPIISNGYVIGYSITNGGAGATGPYTLTFGDVGSGAGAVPGEQTIVNGVLAAIAAGNPGNGLYSGGTTITASGGISAGVPGGGTSAGGNGGRMTNV